MQYKVDDYLETNLGPGTVISAESAFGKRSKGSVKVRLDTGPERWVWVENLKLVCHKQAVRTLRRFGIAKACQDCQHQLSCLAKEKPHENQNLTH